MPEIYTLMYLVIVSAHPSEHLTIPDTLTMDKMIRSNDKSEVLQIARGLQGLKIPGTKYEFAVAVYEGNSKVIFPAEAPLNQQQR